LLVVVLGLVGVVVGISWVVVIGGRRRGIPVNHGFGGGGRGGISGRGINTHMP